MRNIAAGVLSKLEENQITAFVLFYLNLSSAHYYTSCDVPLVHDGHRYEPRALEIDAVSYGNNEIVDMVTVRIDNVLNDLTLEFINGEQQGQAAGLSLIVLDDDLSVIGTVPVFSSGEIDSWSMEADDRISITISSQLAGWNRKTLSRHSSSCRWKVLGGTMCGYAGTETQCDRSYTRCLELGNQANFGGFRFLPSIEGKEIWWGKTKGA